MALDSGQVVAVSISPETIREIAASHISRPLGDNEVDSIAEKVYEWVQEAAEGIYIEAIKTVTGED